MVEKIWDDSAHEQQETRTAFFLGGCFFDSFLFLSFFCSLNHNLKKKLKGRKFSKIGTQAYHMYKNTLKLIWVSLFLVWMTLTEVIEYTSYCQKGILSTVNWENGILPFSHLRKNQVKYKAAILSYKTKVWIFSLLKSMIILFCQAVALIIAPWK